MSWVLQRGGAAGPFLVLRFSWYKSMITKNEGWNIVLAGYWNRMIFTPDWVNRILFSDEPNLETLIGLMPNMPLIYRNSQVTVEISQPRIAFRPRRLDDDCIRRAEQMAEVVLATLKDTPLMGVGLNFAFTEANVGMRADLFAFSDDQQLASTDWNVQTRRIVRQMRHDQDTLNLTLAYDGSEMTIEFNYHTDTSDNESARSAVTNRALRLRDESLRMLRDVYTLELTGEGESDGA